jgi:hypothetical protein
MVYMDGSFVETNYGAYRHPIAGRNPSWLLLSKGDEALGGDLIGRRTCGAEAAFSREGNAH